MKKILFVLTALIAVSCNDKEQFTPAGSDALFSYTFAYDSTLASQTTNQKEVYHISGSTVKLSLLDISKDGKAVFALVPSANRLDCSIAQLSGEYASLESVNLANIDALEYADFALVNTGSLLAQETDPDTEITVTEWGSEAHPVYILHCSADDSDSNHIGFAFRVISVSQVETVDPYGEEVPPTRPFDDVTYKATTDNEVYLEVEYKAFNKFGWL